MTELLVISARINTVDGHYSICGNYINVEGQTIVSGYRDGQDWLNYN